MASVVHTMRQVCATLRSVRLPIGAATRAKQPSQMLKPKYDDNLASFTFVFGVHASERHYKARYDPRPRHIALSAAALRGSAPLSTFGDGGGSPAAALLSLPCPASGHIRCCGPSAFCTHTCFEHQGLLTHCNTSQMGFSGVSGAG